MLINDPKSTVISCHNHYSCISHKKPHPIIFDQLTGRQSDSCDGSKGSLQLFAGAHSMFLNFQDPDTILIDATNAFNNLNQQSALIIVGLSCSSFAKIQ